MSNVFVEMGSVYYMAFDFFWIAHELTQEQQFVGGTHPFTQLFQNNSNTKPFVWTDTADSIFDKIKRLC